MSSLLAARENILRSGRGSTYPLFDLTLQSDQAQVDIDNLIGNVDGHYILRVQGENPNAAIIKPAIYFNDDNAGGNYDMLINSEVLAGDTQAEVLNANEFFLSDVIVSQTDQFMFEAVISGKSGQTKGHIVEVRGSVNTPVNGLKDTVGVWNSTDEINKITVTSGSPFGSSLLGTGIRIQLFTF